MSLETVLVTPPIEKRRARQIAQLVTDSSSFRVVPSTHWLCRTCRCFALPDAHDLLADAACPDDPIWKMDVAELPRLEDAIKQLASHLYVDFTFYMVWAGEARLRDQSVQLPDFLKLISRNEIENRVNYIIGNT